MNRIASTIATHTAQPEEVAEAASKEDLKDWVVDVIDARGGRACLIDVARAIWQRYEPDLRESGDLFFTWQYDMRWAATALRHEGRPKAADATPPGVWELNR